ncbi:MAG: hypothetical protein WDN00_04270 [Limisphaerales bacterium]
MRTLREDGVRKILAGMTTPEEVIRSTVATKNEEMSNHEFQPSNATLRFADAGFARQNF